MPLLIPDTESPEFDTAEAAARALKDKFASTKDDPKETAGLLYLKPNGKFVYSTTMNGSHDHFDFQAGLPKGHKIAGILHTHPTDAQESQVFSPNDIDVAKQLKVPSYVHFLHDDSMRVYTPGKTLTQSMKVSGSPFGLNVAHGDVLPPPPQADPAAMIQALRNPNATVAPVAPVPDQSALIAALRNPNGS